MANTVKKSTIKKGSKKVAAKVAVVASDINQKILAASLAVQKELKKLAG